MNNIESAIHEIHKLDNSASNKTILTRTKSFTKLIIALVYIVLLTSIKPYDLNTIFSMTLFIILITSIGDIKIFKTIKKLRGILILIFIMGLANPILDRNIVIYLGCIPVTQGMISMLVLLFKGVLAVFSSYILISTTSIENICGALKKLYVPNIILVVVMLIYRYLILFLKEAQRMWTAYELRAPNHKGLHFRVWGSMIGSLLIRSLDKSNTLYDSMMMRGFDVDNYITLTEKYKFKDIVILVIFISILLVLRFIPITEFIGNIFI